MVKRDIMYTDFKLYDPSVNFNILDRSKYERNFYITFEELQNKGIGLIKSKPRKDAEISVFFHTFR